jgi:hypothetical protein
MMRKDYTTLGITMTDYFLLDPDYKDFDFPDRHKLKFLTVYGEQNTFIVLAVLGIFMLCLAFYSLIFGLFLPELGYLILGATAQATVITTCKEAGRSYTYAYDVIDMRGDEHHNIGEAQPSNSDTCPQVGSSITVDYIQGQSIISRPAKGIGLPLGSVLFTVVFTVYAYRWLREMLESIHAFLNTRPKLARLKKQSRILDGVISFIGVAPKPKFAGRWEGYYIEITYDFIAYDLFFRGKQVKRRNDLRGKPLPPPGTPVRILYADENTYVML